MLRFFKIYLDSFRGLSHESWMLALVMLINRAGSMVLPFLGVYMTNHLGFGIKTAGVILSFYGIGSVAGSWLGGRLTDKVGEFRVQAVSLMTSVPLFLMIPLFTTVSGLAFIIFLQSLVTETFRPANSVAISKYARKGNITRSFSLNRMAVNLGFSIGPALGGILSDISYNFLFMANALAAFLAGAVYIYFFINKSKSFAEDEDEEVQKEESKPVNAYKDFKFIIFSLLCLLYAVSFFQFVNTLPIFYKEEAGLSQRMIGYVLGFNGLLVVLFEMILVQYAEKRFRLGITLFLGTLLCGISYAILGVSSAIPVLFMAMVITCVGEIWTLPFMYTITAIRSGKGNQGAYMGLLGIGFSVSFIITPSLGTWVAGTFGFSTLWFGTGILLALTAIGFYFVIPWMIGDKRVE